MKRKQQTGFTLVEIAIVLAILGIVLGGLFAGTSALRETAKFKEDQQKLQDIKAALLSYVAVNHYLPCPTNTIDGNTGLQSPPENRATTDGSCDVTYGYLPYADLGTHAVNAYGVPFSYVVNQQANLTTNTSNEAHSASYFGAANCNINAGSPPCFYKDTPPTAADTGSGNFRITNGTSQVLADNIPLLVISHGQNKCTNVNGYEQQNCSDSATTYFQAPQNREGTNAFDDVLIWLSSLEIKRTNLSIFASDPTEAPVTPPSLPSDLIAPPPPEDIEFKPESTLEGDYDGTNLDIITNNSNGDEVLIIGDINASINLGNGNDTLYLVKDDAGNGGDLNAPLTGDQQYKTIYIEGDVNADIILDGNQGNSIEVGGNVNATIELNSNGINQLIVHGNINGSGSIIMQRKKDSNTVYIGNNVLGPVSVDNTVYLGKIPAQVTNDEFNQINAGSIKCRDPNDTSNFIPC
ncbi:type II secretion system protein [Thiomicrospira pelophila]|uniref:type II secretion system protein n=1 Tax=Thiomicrospira pelophila TaxID=934 RepID=UPI0005718A2B|nr:type II secretion system protein [Thiomicrospira pelophila]